MSMTKWASVTQLPRTEQRPHAAHQWTRESQLLGHHLIVHAPVRRWIVPQYEGTIKPVVRDRCHLLFMKGNTSGENDTLIVNDSGKCMQWVTWHYLQEICDGA
jgi:hypothetical protein